MRVVCFVLLAASVAGCQMLLSSTDEIQTADAAPPASVDAAAADADGPAASFDAALEGDDALAPEGARIAFVTLSTSPGSGISGGANQMCSASGIAGRTFVPWISIATRSARFRFAPSALGFKRTDGVLITARDSLAGPAFANPLDRDQYGDRVVGRAWTGTDAAGLATAYNCEGWASSGSGTAGTIGSPGNGWTDDSKPANCSDNLHIYCVEQAEQ